MKPSRTYLEYLIRARCRAAKALRAAEAEDRRQRKFRACADDATIYATYELRERYDTIVACLEAYREFKKMGKA